MTESGAEQPYEQNIDRLRQVVESLEGESLSLEQSLKLFEEGMELSRLCDTQLQLAEERVRVLVESKTELNPRKEIPLQQVRVEDVRENVED